MADGIFFFSAHLGEGMVIAFWLEDGIIAEPLCATPFTQDGARTDTFEKIFLSFVY